MGWRRCSSARPARSSKEHLAWSSGVRCRFPREPHGENVVHGPSPRPARDRSISECMIRSGQANPWHKRIAANPRQARARERRNLALAASSLLPRSEIEAEALRGLLPSPSRINGDGAPDRIRTCDLCLRRQHSIHLSYGCSALTPRLLSRPTGGHKKQPDPLPGQPALLAAGTRVPPRHPAAAAYRGESHDRVRGLHHERRRGIASLAAVGTAPAEAVSRLGTETPLLSETARRFENLAGAKTRIHVIAAAAHEGLVRETLAEAEVPLGRLLLEPCARHGRRRGDCNARRARGWRAARSPYPGRSRGQPTRAVARHDRGRRESGRNAHRHVRHHTA